MQVFKELLNHIDTKLIDQQISPLILQIGDSSMPFEAKITCAKMIGYLAEVSLFFPILI